MNPTLLRQLQPKTPPLRELLASQEVIRDYIDAAPDAWQFLGADQVLEIGGVKKKPNKYRGYCEFRLGYCFPVISSYRTSIHSGTLANSWETMVDQNFNYGHQIARYYKGTEAETRVQNDRIVGAIVGVEFAGGQNPRNFRLGTDKEPPGLRCVAALFKQAKGMDRILGQHLSSRHEWTVSMEIDYRLEESGVVLMPREGANTKFPKAEAALIEEHTPAEFRQANLSYLPLLAAPDDLIDCFSEELGVWGKPWHGHDIVTMLGGLDGQIHFKGAGIVQYGAEPTAEIDQLLASKPGNDSPDIRSFEQFGQSLERLATALEEQD